jgi:hypothetical protein
MPIKPIGGEINSQDINDNISYLESKANDPVTTMEANGKKIPLSLFADDALQAIAGTTSVTVSKGILVNQGDTYPLQNVMRDNVLNTVDQKVKDAILEVKVIGAKPGKYYGIEWLGNGYDDAGTIRYGFTIAEYDKATFATDSMSGRRQIAYFRTNNFPAPTENIVTRVLDLPSENMIFIITYDRSKIGGTVLRISDAAYGVAKGCVIHENNYVYRDPVRDSSGEKPLVVTKAGRRIRTKFKYSDTQDMVLDLDSLGINEITHIKRVYFQSNTTGKLTTTFDETGLYETITSDWVSPYGIMAKNNTVSSSTFTVGGNHGTSGGSGFPTARHIETKVYADGREVLDGDILAADKVVIKAIHHIAASNVINTTDGSKRDCVKEIVTYTITPRHAKISVELEALEPVDITRYAGFQATKSGWDKDLYFMEDTIQQIYDISTDWTAKNSGLYPTAKPDRFVLKKSGHVLMGYGTHDFGLKYSQIADGQTMIYLTEGEFGKIYKHFIKGTTVTLQTGQSIYFVGGYIFSPDLPKSVATTAASYYDNGEKIYVLDFFSAGEVFFMPDIRDVNKEVVVIKKSNSITIDNYVTGKGVKINSTGYGQVFFKLK